MRILVVEDEPKAGDYLKKGLSESGFVVDLARTGPDGQHLATSEDYDLVILDVMLPGIDGWRVMQEIRNVMKRSRETGRAEKPGFVPAGGVIRGMRHGKESF